MPSDIAASDLMSQQAAGHAPQLLDVMTPEHYATMHIPGARQACIYEVSFLDQVAALFPDKSVPLVVYGTSARSLASQVAAERLIEAGYHNVRDLRGGLDAWGAAGGAIARGPAPPQDSLTGTFALDTERSVVRWTGRNLLNHHEGTVRFKSGEVVVRDGAWQSAQFTIDLSTIACHDIADSAMNAMLIRHLHDLDFFGTSRWPHAHLVVTSATPLPVREGSPNYAMSGDLTLRGECRAIEFHAVVGSLDGQTLAGQAELDLDRTRWGSIYGSGRFFEALGKHVVNDLIHLHIKILANRTSP